MKWIKKLTLFICCVLISNAMSVQASDNQVVNVTYSSAVPSEVSTFVIRNEDNFIQAANGLENWCARTVEGCNELDIGEPYIIYNVGFAQDEVYYYPMIDSNTGTIKYIVGVIGTIDGYVFEIKESMVDILNELDYMNNDWIFYTCLGDMYAESLEEIVNLGSCSLTSEKVNVSSADETLFVNMTYSEKLNFIMEETQNMKPYAPIAWENEDNKLDVLLGTALSLYNPMGQYNYNMCWASSVATIVNYIKSSNVTGFDVCNRVGIGYDAGGSVYNMQDGLANYNVDYDYIRNCTLAWDEIQDNIDSGKPIGLCAFGTLNSIVYGHAAVIYGYTGTGSSRQIIVWDPYGNSGRGTGTTVNFDSTYKCFSIDGVVYAWESTLSSK